MPYRKTNSLDRKRLLFLSLFLFALFAILIVQYYHIQIIEGDIWSKKAEKQHYFTISEPFMRGIFISNTSIKKGHPELAQNFVIDVQKFHLYADPMAIPEENRQEVAKNIAAILKFTLSEETDLLTQLNIQTRSRKLRMWLNKNEQGAILKWWYPFAKGYKIPRNALFFTCDYQRSYPFGKLLGQVLHTLQSVKDEATAQGKPTGGLELYFNDILQGKQGKRKLMRSPRNSLEIGEVIAKPQHGANIYLTINHCLQAIAEEEIAKGVQNSKAKSGWAVMLDPYSGEILALAQYPFFNPADYQSYFNNPLLTEHTKVKAITDANEPGSIMKPITIAIALKANDELIKRGKPRLFDPNEMMETSNSHFPGRRKPLKDTSFHRFLNMNLAIQKSSNIYVARLVERIIARLGVEWYRNALAEFGFGKKTGIELPSESAGRVPTPGKSHPNGALEWSLATPYSLAMGHNIQTTSLQIAVAIASFANGGYLVKPTLVRKIVKPMADGSEEILYEHKTYANQERIVSEAYAKDVVRAMKYTTKIGGTAKRADVFGYSEAGKTGTGDKAINGFYDPRFVASSFVGFTPTTNPAFVLIVTIDEPQYGYIPGIGRMHFGGTSSSPVFREIATRSLEYLGIDPDDPFGYPVGDPRYDPSKADWLLELKEIKELYDKWNLLQKNP